jgi:hypothetical protein
METCQRHRPTTAESGATKDLQKNLSFLKKDLHYNPVNLKEREDKINDQVLTNEKNKS